ncbi:MAG: lactonase family protein, partial [Proteobacteria bacterium]|nr:lactonase family protein [Pseudomonadota bacterium]
MGQLIAYVGTYGAAPGTIGGGIFALEVSADGRNLRQIAHAPEPRDAGYLVHASDTGTLYAVDERKTDGRGPVDKPAAVHALKIDAVTGALVWRHARLAPGPRPTFLDYSAEQRLLVSANHGDFQHVEKVVRRPEGGWGVDYVYDDSTVVVFPVDDDGGLDEACDVQVFFGHGLDPNSSPQNGGHAQSNPHAHCAVIDPSGRYLLVCDKGADRIVVFRLGLTLEPAFTLQFEPETGPRHLAFDPVSGLAYATLEFSSQLASLRFDAGTGALVRLDTVSTLAQPVGRCNEPAEVRVHPAGGFIYVNNRGEDALAWFSTDEQGRLARKGAVSLAASIHPGLAARSFTFDPSGAFVLVADRPAHLVRSYAVCAQSGALVAQGELRVP